MIGKQIIAMRGAIIPMRIKLIGGKQNRNGIPIKQQMNVVIHSA